MSTVNIPPFKLIGLRLPQKTTNKGGQSTIDCGNLWQKFSLANVPEKIVEKLSDEVYAVYFQYEGDHTKPFSYFIGCKVKIDTNTPEELDSVVVPAGTYSKVAAKGKMPDCVVKAWEKIWKTTKGRAYTFDFEIYDQRSRDWNDAEIDIYISSKR
jgi:predicted transcriptional regulator YdeE